MSLSPIFNFFMFPSVCMAMFFRFVTFFNLFIQFFLFCFFVKVPGLLSTIRELWMTRTNREDVEPFVSLYSFVELAVGARSVEHVSYDLAAPLSERKNKCVYDTSVCKSSQRGSGAVIAASRKVGAVNLVVSRIERGYLKRIRTAGSTACVNNHVDSRGTGTDGSGHPAAERTSTTARDGDDDTQVQSMSNTPRQRVQAGVVDKRVIGKPDLFDGDPMKNADWSFKLRSVPRSRGSAVSKRADEVRSIVDTETQRKSRERRKRTQHTDVLHSGDDNCRSRVGQVLQIMA